MTKNIMLSSFLWRIREYYQIKFVSLHRLLLKMCNNGKKAEQNKNGFGRSRQDQ
jgi:hypothetical protein